MMWARRTQMPVMSWFRVDAGCSDVWLPVLLLAFLTAQIALAQIAPQDITTGLELQKIIRQGAQDVVVTNHFDARFLNSTSGSTFLVRSDLRTLQVRYLPDETIFSCIICS